MLSTKRCLTILALAALTTAASAQADVQTPPPTGKPGYALCFGDGTGTPCPDRNPGKLGHGCENSLGNGGGLLWADGVAKVSKDTITLHVKDLPLKSTVLFMQATGCRNNEMGFPFGDGLMCMGGSMMKLGVSRASDGTSEFPPTGSLFSLSKAGLIPPTGGERYYQVLYRDSEPLMTSSEYNFNLTNAWSIAWVK